MVVQLNRKLCSRYKANRNFPPVYSAFWSSLVIANFCAALTTTGGGGRRGGKRAEWQSRRDYPHEVHGYWKKENTILSRPYTRVLVYSINGGSDIACPPSKHIFLFGPQWPPMPFWRRRAVHILTFKWSYIRSGFLVPRYACILFYLSCLFTSILFIIMFFECKSCLKGITILHILFRKLYFRTCFDSYWILFLFYILFYFFFIYICNDQ